MASQLYKIDSPYAKFGPAGQLTCTLCNHPVKSAKVWIAHVNGKQHRENLSAKTQKKQEIPTQPKPAPANVQKRPAPETSGLKLDAKKAKVVPNERSQQSTISKASGDARKPMVTQQRPLPHLTEDNDSESDSDQEMADVKPQIGPSNGLPSDFFDASTSKAVEKSEPASTAVEPMKKEESKKSGELPEGFFDDRKMDAKVRGVEPKDPLDEEWGKFQKEIQKVEVVSEHIIEEDEDHNALERDLEEVEEQLHAWSRINKLEKRKETLAETASVAAIVKQESSPESTDDEMDDNVNLDEVLDWRSKDVWK